MKKVKGYLFRRKSKDGKLKGPYYVQFRFEGKTYIKSTGETSERKAEKKRDEIVAPFQARQAATVQRNMIHRLSDMEAEANQLDAAANPPPAIAAIWNRFLASPSRPDSGEATLRGYEIIWRRFASWLADRHPEVEHLHAVTPAMAAEYAADLSAAKVSASTYNQHRNLLRMVWRVMADDSRLPVNVWDRIMPKKLNALATRKRALTPAQFEALLAAVESDQDFHDLFTLLAWTGQRLADIVLLKWGSIDFKTRVISLAPMKTARRQGKIVHIPLFPAAAEVLNRRQSGKELNPAGYVFKDMAADYKRDQSAISKRITAAFKAAGMDTSEERADRKRVSVVYGAHSLRHYFVTVAASAGMPAAMIKSITGHGSDGMLEHYQQIGASLASEMAQRIGNGNDGATLPKALPEPGTALLGQIRAGLEAMTAKSWERERDRLLEILPAT